MNQNRSTIIILAVVVAMLFVGVGTYAFSTGRISLPTATPKACTQEAKQCPDGSYVARIGKNCEFAECPTINPTPIPGPTEEQISLREGQRGGSFLLEKIYSDRVTGINYPEYPVGGGPGNPVSLRIGETVSNGCTVVLTLVSIQGNTATFIKKTDNGRPCPICLSGTTRIDTPSGSVSVKDVQVGMSIWTTDKAGNRIPGVVIKTSQVTAPSTHQIVHLILNDGRRLLASPGHPTIDGRIIGDLAIGDSYDGASVMSAELVPYDESATYDVLPSGDTGFYFANGILLDSTLH